MLPSMPHRSGRRRSMSRLSRSRLYLFRYGNSALYACAADNSEHALPKPTSSEIQWTYEGAVRLVHSERVGCRKAVKTMLEAIRNDGFYLMHQAFQDELLDYLCQCQVEDESLTRGLSLCGSSASVTYEYGSVLW